MPPKRHWRGAGRIAVLTVLATACGSPKATEPSGVASVAIQPADTVMVLNTSATFRAVAKTAAGAPVAGTQATWQSSVPSVATVTGTGVVTALAYGTTTLTATIDGITGQAVLRVPQPISLTVTNAWLTQGIQRDDGTVPLVMGRATMLNVSGTLDRRLASGDLRPNVRTRIYHGTSVVYENVSPMTGTPEATPVPWKPVHQALIPPSALGPGMAFTVEVNSDGTVPEADLSDNVWPRDGVTQPATVQTVAPLGITFVPIFLSTGRTVGPVTPSNLSEYLIDTRRMHPVAEVLPMAGEVFTSDVDFGTGTAGPWIQLLNEIDVVRIAGGTDRYYVGVVRPPAGVTSVQFSGYGYIPANPLSSGRGTRTNVVIGLGWFNSPTKTSQTVAHELGHNFGRYHVPCGGPASPDPAYPYPNGSIGAWGHDVYGFSRGDSTGAASYESDYAKDLMSYCSPIWVSDYTYEAVMAVRRTAAAAPQPTETCDCLVVYGTITPTGVEFGPPLQIEGHAGGGDPDGGWRLEGLDARGGSLFSVPFRPGRIDHAPDYANFALALPLDAATRRAVTALRVSDPAGRNWRTSMPRGPSPRVSAGRGVGGAVELTWNPAAGGILVRDPASGQVVGIGRTGRLVLPARRGRLEVTVGPGLVEAETLILP